MHPKADDVPEFDTISEAAAALRVCRATIHNLINRKLLRRVKVLGATRIYHEDVLRIARNGANN